MSRTIRAEEARDVIARVLAPYLGQTMAASSAKLYLERLGAERPIGAPEVEQLLKWIGPGVRVFVGEQRAQHVLKELRDALTQLVGGA